MDHNGKTIIPIEYTAVEIKGIYIYVYTNNEEMIVYNMQGEKVTNLKYSSIMKTQNENYSSK